MKWIEKGWFVRIMRKILKQGKSISSNLTLLECKDG